VRRLQSVKANCHLVLRVSLVCLPLSGRLTKRLRKFTSSAGAHRVHKQPPSSAGMRIHQQEVYGLANEIPEKVLLTLRGAVSD
jgi:hypothetical protein